MMAIRVCCGAAMLFCAGSGRGVYVFSGGMVGHAVVTLLFVMACDLGPACVFAGIHERTPRFKI